MISLGGIQLCAVQKHSEEWSVKEMEQATGYFVVKQKALPEVLLKVVEAKRLRVRTCCFRAGSNRTGGDQPQFFL